MSHLPNAEAAVVDEHKVTAYLLSDSHPAGRAKAAFFRLHGFQGSAWKILRDALLSHARTAGVIATVATEFGMKYILDGPFVVPDGRWPHLRTVWFVAKGETVPRLVTAYPAPGGDE